MSSRRAFSLALLVYLVLRVWLLTASGYESDLESYRGWAIASARDGLFAAYAEAGADYPPVFLYLLGCTARVYLAFHPEVAGSGDVPHDRWLTAAVKLPHLVFDLALAALLWWLVTARGWWGERRTAAAYGRLAALLWLWNPAVLFGSAYWGQPDGIHSFFALASLAALAGGRAATGGALLAVAGLMKPLAAPLVPLFAVATALRGRLRWVLAAAIGGMAAVSLVFLPFALDGHLGVVLRRVLVDIDAMPFTSVNAHNLWWLGGGWRPANEPAVGALTPRWIGILLFLAAYVAIVARALPWLRDRTLDRAEWGARLSLTAAAVYAAFFFLVTHMHENHLMLAIPLLIAVAGRWRGAAWIAALASVASFLNMAWHDLDLPYALPWPLGAISGITDPHLARPYAWGQYVGGYVDVMLTFVVALGAALVAWRAAERQA